MNSLERILGNFLICDGWSNLVIIRLMVGAVRGICRKKMKESQKIHHG